MSRKLDGYTLKKTLGEGFSGKVYLAVDADNNKYAIKVMQLDTNMNANRQKILHMLETEVSALKELHHKNVIKLIDFKSEATMKRSVGSVRVAYVVLELAMGGELFDFIAMTGKFSEEIARFYFKQLLSGLHYLHSHGFAHRDLKPDNLLLDAKFNLKIADFGFAAPTKGREGDMEMRTYCGTPNYQAPELLY